MTAAADVSNPGLPSHALPPVERTDYSLSFSNPRLVMTILGFMITVLVVIWTHIRQWEGCWSSGNAV